MMLPFKLIQMHLHAQEYAMYTDISPYSGFFFRLYVYSGYWVSWCAYNSIKKCARSGLLSLMIFVYVNLILFVE